PAGLSAPGGSAPRANSIPAVHPAALQPADLELGSPGAACFHRELDHQPLCAVDRTPQRTVVFDEHGDGLVGIGPVGRHAARLTVVDGHRHLAGAVTRTGEIPAAEHQVAAAAPV